MLEWVGNIVEYFQTYGMNEEKQKAFHILKKLKIQHQKQLECEAHVEQSLIRFTDDYQRQQNVEIKLKSGRIDLLDSLEIKEKELKENNSPDLENELKRINEARVYLNGELQAEISNIEEKLSQYDQNIKNMQNKLQIVKQNRRKTEQSIESLENFISSTDNSASLHIPTISNIHLNYDAMRPQENAETEHLPLMREFTDDHV